MRWSFWIELRGATRLWVAAITFLIVGALLAFVLPTIVRPGEQAREVWLALGVLGATFIVLGLAVLLPMLATLFIAPERRGTWHWWINFIGGLLGALAFAVPATAMFPIFFLAYITRPNMLAPNDANAALFSILGVAALALIFFLARKMVREKRNPVEWTYHKEM